MRVKRVLVIFLGAAALLLVGIGAWAYTPDKSRAALNAAYAVAPSDMAEIAGMRLHVVESGPSDAPAVILLHGFGSSLLTWDTWAATLSKRYRVIRYDLPGFGLTGADPTGDYSDDRGLAVLGAVMTHFGVTRATLVGNSMGGKLAWQFAARFPDRVSNLVLISPDGFASQGFEYDKPAQVPLMVRMLPYSLPTAMVRMSLAPAYGDPARLTDAVLRRYRDMMLAPGVRGAMLARLEQTVVRDPVPLLRQITAPTLLLWGDKDGMIPITNAADYTKLIKGATLVTLPGIGHTPQEEAPAAALGPVLAMLDHHAEE